MADEHPSASAKQAADASVLNGARLDELCLFNLLSTSIDTVYFKDLESRFIRVSDSQAKLSGASSAAAMHGKTDFEYFTAEYATATRAAEQEIIRTGVPQVDLHEYRVLPGERGRVISSTKQALRDFDGRIVGTFGINRDLTANRHLEAELAAKTSELDRLSRELRTILDISPDPIARFDTDLRYTYVNAATESLTGLPAEELVGRGFRARGLPEDDVRERERNLSRVIATGRTITVEYCLTVAGARRFLQVHLVPELDDDGRVRSVLAVSHDLTDRKRIEDTLAAEAMHDPLTGLANRRALIDGTRRALELSATHEANVAILFIDVDRFKTVNDMHGHSVGDAVLIAAAGRIRKAARQNDIVARFGGDEFAIVCEKVQSPADAATIARRVTSALLRPFDDIRPDLDISASIGIAVAQPDTKDPEQLLRAADVAMYKAKALHRADGAFVFFDVSDDHDTVSRGDQPIPDGGSSMGRRSASTGP